jgi:pimeloyl-ACP methyl ester carboxylesterase
MSQEPSKNVEEAGVVATSRNPVRHGFFFRLCRAVLIGVVLFYTVACVLVFYFQRKLLFVPPVRSTEQVAWLAQQGGLARWTNSAGIYLGMKRLSPVRPAEAAVLICYGNGGSATGRASYADDLQQVAPLDVYILQYPGYEDRSGQPTRETLLQAATEALQAVGTNRPVYLLGESLGTGVASYLAGKFPDRISGVILLSPYERLADVAQYQYPWLPARWLMLDDMWSGKFLAAYHGPVGVMVDGRDNVVPEKFGLRLYDGYHGPKQLWQFPDGFHITIMEPPNLFWGKVLNFWKANPLTAAK